MPPSADNLSHVDHKPDFDIATNGVGIRTDRVGAMHQILGLAFANASDCHFQRGGEYKISSATSISVSANFSSASRATRSKAFSK